MCIIIMIVLLFPVEIVESGRYIFIQRLQFDLRQLCVMITVLKNKNKNEIKK